METLRRRETYYVNIKLELEPEQTAAGRCHKVRLYIINFRNRCLTLENLDTLSAFMPALQCRLTGQPDLPLPLIANVRTNCLRSPFTYKDEDVENATCCSLVEKPAQVMMTPAGFRLPAGRLLSPPHPDKVSITVLKADWRNVVRSLEWGGVFFSRVVSSCYSAAEEQVKGWFRVSDYTEDGHMILSVLCYFPIVEVEREGREEPQKKRKREESVDGSTQKRLRL
ncbi:uncharacterized protein LOC108888763 [Lates calcarifer]|uniref:Uncharacterized protein LOC108888763 n=1 Tax=Lates calcarifer TaxID=8187 RepID=A0AAJ7PWE7_LATCA|nr:uncharacterized protein LOC108888763 [Lates calcarifer]